jgi:hypothetical protein
MYEVMLLMPATKKKKTLAGTVVAGKGHEVGWVRIGNT